jgi:hypothetical protein
VKSTAVELLFAGNRKSEISQNATSVTFPYVVKFVQQNVLVWKNVLGAPEA